MEKEQCKQINQLFSVIDFIDRLETMSKNNGAVAIAAIISQRPRMFGHPQHHPMQNMPEPLVFPPEITKMVFEDLLQYRDNLKEMLDNMVIVDKSELPEPPAEENPEPGEGEGEGDEDPKDGDDEDDGDSDDDESKSKGEPESE